MSSRASWDDISKDDVVKLAKKLQKKNKSLSREVEKSNEKSSAAIQELEGLREQLSHLERGRVHLVEPSRKVEVVDNSSYVERIALLEELLKQSEKNSALKDEQLASLQSATTISEALPTPPVPPKSKDIVRSNSQVERASIAKYELEIEALREECQGWKSTLEDSKATTLVARTEVKSLQEQNSQLEKIIDSYEARCTLFQAKLNVSRSTLGSVMRGLGRELERTSDVDIRGSVEFEDARDVLIVEARVKLKELEEKYGVDSGVSVELDIEHTIREMRRSRDRTRENLDYLKYCVLKFLMFSGKIEEQCSLVPVICELLHFSPEETQAVLKLWRTDPEGWLW